MTISEKNKNSFFLQKQTDFLRGEIEKAQKEAGKSGDVKKYQELLHTYLATVQVYSLFTE